MAQSSPIESQTGSSPPIDDLYTPKEVAILLKVSVSFVYNLIATTELPVVELGRSSKTKRITASDLKAYIQNNTRT
jgi:excisionase family DNA binding protein